jgi:serine/threonine-protein kinase
VVGGYKLTAYLGGGGMADVYLGLDLMLEREVAIKIPLPELASQPHIAERFRSEAVLLAKLNHPHIATLYSFHRDVVGDLFMVMEYVPGRTLDATLRAGGALKSPEAVTLFAQILDGIGHAHAQGIIHRDLKPANVMLTPTGTVKIMDFGIAHALGGQRLTMPGRLIGTFEYMSPEQVLGQATDPRSDIYALGILLFEMVTGRVPFSRNSEYELMRAQLEEPPPPPREFAPETPEFIEQAILRALQKRREDRFQTVTEFRTALAPLALATTPKATRLVSEAEIEAQAAATRRAEAERLAAELRRQAEVEAAQILADARRRAEEEATRITDEQRRRAEQEAERLAAEKLREAEAAAAQLLAESQRQAEAETLRAAHALRQVEEAVQQQHAAQEAKRLQQQQAEEARLQREREEIERLHQEAEARRRQAEEEAAQLKAAARQQAEAEHRQREAEQQRQRAAEAEARRAEEARLAALAQQAAAERQAAAEAAREAEAKRQQLAAEAERMAAEARQKAEQEAARRAQEIQQQAEQEAARLLEEARQRVVVTTATISGENLHTAARRHADLMAETPAPRRWSRAGRWSAGAAAIVLLGWATIWLQSGTEPPPPPPPRPSPSLTPPYTPEVISLPGGTFWLGRKDLFPQEGEDVNWASLQGPAHTVTVNPFEIDKTEVTNAEYAEFVQATGHAPPAEGDWPNGALLPGRERWPVRYVNYADAEAFAQWRSQRDRRRYRLPTEAEWEFAAKGTRDLRYPWGNQWDETRANLNSGTPKPVGTYPSGASWAGVLDLLGNVAEWTSSPAQKYSDKISDPGAVIVRGGAFQSGRFKNRPPSVTARGPVLRDTRDLEIGFRLVREVP